MSAVTSRDIMAREHALADEITSLGKQIDAWWAQHHPASATLSQLNELNRLTRARAAAKSEYCDVLDAIEDLEASNAVTHESQAARAARFAQNSRLEIDWPGHEFDRRAVRLTACTKRGSAMVHVYDHVYALVELDRLRIVHGGRPCR